MQGDGYETANIIKCHMGKEGGLKSVKKCYVLFEWP